MKLVKRIGQGVATVGLFLSGAYKAHAAAGGFETNYVPPGKTVDLRTITDAIDKIAQTLLYIGVTVAVIFIIWGGLAYMFAGGNSEKAEKAKTRLWNGIIGALIVIGVGLIIKTITTLVQSGI